MYQLFWFGKGWNCLVIERGFIIDLIYEFNFGLNEESVDVVYYFYFYDILK